MLNGRHRIPPTHPHRLGVLGWPVGHSRSPAMQNAALRAVGLDGWRYQLLGVPPELFAETVAALPAAGFRGANVTIPHKQAALAFAVARDGPVSERARAIGAVNTLVFDDGGSVRADNTDAPALVGALPFPAAGRSALVLGAGGTARAAVWALLDAGMSTVRVWNRTPDRARELCAAVGGSAVEDDFGADVLVNCTPVGLHGDEGALPVGADVLGKYSLVVDYAYTEGGTPLVRLAARLSVPYVDGLQLLVGQGALSFEQLTGVPAPVSAMRAAVGWRDD